MSSRPNIIVILADDMGYGDIGAFGNAAVHTPALDRLARQGIALRQHYSASPVCAPARAGLLTGRYPHRTGAIDTLEMRGLDRLALREITLADALRAAGYATGLAGKWHLGALDARYHPNRRGFDEFAGFRGGWQDYWKWTLDCNGATRPADGRYLTDVFTDQAVQFIRRHRGRPFFLHLAYNAPHFPLQAPQEDLAPFAGRFTPAVSLIYAMNRRMDAGIGRVLETLEELGLAQNTIVLFASDNGPDMGGQGDNCAARYNANLAGSKLYVLEGGIRVPAIVRWPAGLPGGREVHDVVHFNDWLPTLLSAAGAGLPAHRQLDGVDALPVLRGDKRHIDPVRFWQWNRYTPLVSCNAAMRDGRWKLVRPALREAMWITDADAEMDKRAKYEPHAVGGLCREPEPARNVPDPPPPMLFDLEADPCERNDLAGQHPQRVAGMLRELERWFESVERDRRSIDDAW